MSGENKKPITIAIVCAAIIVLLFGLGAGFGGARADGANTWKQRLDGLNPGSPLPTADMRPVGSGCVVAEESITVSGSCLLAVASFGGAFSLETTKRARVVAASNVILTLAIEGTSTSKNISPDDDPVEVVIGRGGGTLQIQCLLTSVCVLGML